MQLPPESVRTRVLLLPSLWSAPSTGLQTVIHPQPFKSTGSCLFTDDYKKSVYDCYLQDTGNTRQNEKSLSFVSLNLGCYMVEGTDSMFGVVLPLQRNDVGLIEIINFYLKTVDFLLP